MQSVGSTLQVEPLGVLSLFGVRSPVEVLPKTVLFEQGSPAEDLYWLDAGIVLLQSFGPAPESSPLEFLLPGDLFGEEALAANATNSASASFLVRGSVRRIPRRELLESVGRQPRFLLGIAEQIICRHRRGIKRIAQFCSQGVFARILSSLVEMSPHCPATDGLESCIPLPQASLAQMIYSTRETVSTKLNRMAEDNLVVLAPSRIGIPSVERLRDSLSRARCSGR